MNDELDYTGTQSFNGNPINTVAQDEKDEPVLKFIQKILTDKIEFYSTVDSLDIEEKLFPLKEQVAHNARVRNTLLEMQSAIEKVLEDIGEKYGR